MSLSSIFRKPTFWCSLSAVVATVFLVTTCKTGSNRPSNKVKTDQHLPPKRELRAVWIATVDNIDWPSRKNLSPEDQRQEFIQLIQAHKKTGINAVFVQVRAAADAFYAKGSEPWSEWLTGKQGQAPDPLYDPLEFMIDECHRRGLEFHAWLNMNRAVHKASKSIAPDNIAKKHPEWILDYDGYKLFNFGVPEVRDYITNVTLNIVQNYDVDGIHFDDYFYPYTVVGQTLKDNETFTKYGGQFANKDDWRRNNIDLIIKQISDGIAATKPYIKFGVSPFGVWRNKKDDHTGSDTQGGQTSFDNLYADTKKWTKAGWIDYIVPQIYFSIKHDKVPFKTLTNWWLQNAYKRHLYIGQGAYKVGQDKDRAWQSPDEMSQQIQFLRANEGVTGSVFFSSKSLINNKLGFADSLQNNYYKYAALPPTMPWKDDVPPNSPQNLRINESTKGIELMWDKPQPAKDQETARYYAVYRFGANEIANLNDPRRIVGFCYDKQGWLADKTAQNGKDYVYLVTAFDRLHNESEAAKGRIKVKNLKKNEQKNH